MDENVKLAMLKWPKVPHCYGWLALDARGAWRMLDERAQALKLAGDKIRHSALLAFINRNYLHDERGCWYFQNGPQRVYLQLEITPFVAHIDPALGWVLHTGEVLDKIDAVWLTEKGRLLLKSVDKIACLDDRDWINCLDQLSLSGEALSEEAFSHWLTEPDQAMRWHWRQQTLVVQAIHESEIAERFGFQLQPQPPI
jgi:Protein of unknown function (DUF2946)